MTPGIDPRYGRMLGEHGEADDAIEWVLQQWDEGFGDLDVAVFLSGWRDGDLEEFPEFNAWLNDRLARREGLRLLQLVCDLGLDAREYPVARVAEDLIAGDTIACHICGLHWPTCLVDSKAPLLPLSEMFRQRRLRSEDFTVHLCPPCYGPTWEPA
jgi:hypothetical protein